MKNKKRKFWYWSTYSEKKRLPKDPFNERTEIGVIVEEAGKELGEFFFTVLTKKVFDRELGKNGGFFTPKGNFIIVEKFDFDLIDKAVEFILPEIEKYGERPFSVAQLVWE